MLYFLPAQSNTLPPLWNESWRQSPLLGEPVSREVFEQAKLIAMTRYDVVGLTEELDATMCLLRRQIPGIWREEPRTVTPAVDNTREYTPLSATARSVLRQNGIELPY